MSDYDKVKRWRSEHPRERKAQKERNYARGAEHTHNGRSRWTAAEDEIILKVTSMTDRELGETLGRSVQAIQSRRTRLNARPIV